jgi:hypothetical protein
MRSSSRFSNLPKLVALLAVVAACAYVLTQPAAPPDATRASAAPTSLPQPSNFVASGGLVTDTDPSVPAASEALSHATAKTTVPEEVSTF